MVKPKSTLKCFILIALEPLEPTKPERCVAGHYSGVVAAETLSYEEAPPENREARWTCNEDEERCAGGR
jgi:hypothetical protein